MKLTTKCKKIIIVIIVVVISLFFVNSKAYSYNDNATMKEYDYLMSGKPIVGETARAEQILTEINQRDLIRRQPPVKLDYSLERDQLIRRTKLWNERNKIAFIYLFTQGRLVGHFTIKGKVSSVNSALTAPEFAWRNGGGTVILPSPAEDGSYGSNGDGVFFFLTDGTYMEWNDSYLLVDRPLKLNVEPLTVYTEGK